MVRSGFWCIKGLISIGLNANTTLSMSEGSHSCMRAFRRMYTQCEGVRGRGYMQNLMRLGLTRRKADAHNWAIDNAICMAIFSGHRERQIQQQRRYSLDERDARSASDSFLGHAARCNQLVVKLCKRPRPTLGCLTSAPMGQFRVI